MNIAYVNADPGVPVFGSKGSSLHVREVITALLKRGARIDLFASRIGGQKPPNWGRVRLHELGAITNEEGSAREQAAYDANKSLLDALGHSESDMVYERYSLWSFAGMEFARQRHIPGILEVNAPLIREQSAYRKLHNPSLAQQVTERAFGAAGALLAVSDEVADYLESCGVPREKIHVVPNAINPERFSEAIEPAVAAPGECVIGFVGSLRPWHGLNVLLEAFARVSALDRSYRLLLVGDGPERVRIEAEIQQRNIAHRTTLVGAVPAHDVPAYLRSIDIAVAPYPALPGFYFSPLKVYEYMAAGCAVIASRVGQLRTLVQHGVTGWHVPPGDACALAESIVHLSERPKLRAEMGKAARKIVMENHTWDLVAARILRLARLNDAELLHGPA